MYKIGDKVKLVCNTNCLSENGVEGDIISYDSETGVYTVIWYTGCTDEVFASQIIFVDDFAVGQKVASKYDHSFKGEVLELEEYKRRL